MKTFLIIFSTALSIGLISSKGYAQAQQEPCGSGILHDHLMEHDAQYARSRHNAESRIIQFQQDGNYRDEEVFSVPVVVHIIHEGEPIGQGSNITDEQVFSAIVALNNDFRHVEGTNGFGDGEDVGIEFCLAARDPNGNSSNGIVRINGTGVPDYAEEGIASVNGVGASETAVKALSTWPRTEYMNIWLVNEIEDNNGLNGIQGYAYFPTNSPLDGIVILHNAFGTVGNLKPNTNLNRTTSHEVGHYFALYHTFHSTNNCNVEANCNTAGDRVCDTPVTPLQSSCGNPACSGTQQVENYMDYTSEICRNMFSQGQKNRMRATILSSRSSLLQSLGCIPVTDYDAAVTAINHPVGSLCNGTFQPEIQVSNYGSFAVTSLTITYGVVGEAAATYNWNGNIASGNSTTITLPNYTTGVGEHSFFAASSLPSGYNDEYLNNDEMDVSFVIANGAGAVLTFTVDYFGSETTWDIFDSGAALLLSGGPYIDNQQGTVFVENLCLSTGCFDLVVYDEYGDGMGFTNGNFQLHDSEGILLGSGTGNFGDEITVNFCLEAEVPVNLPVAAFIASDQTVCTSTQVDFTSQSQNASTWSWIFSGGSPASSTQQHPQNITYANPGSYAVTLTVENAEGTENTLSLNSYISVSGGPSLSTSTDAVNCNGQSNGSAAVTASGYSPFTYSWSNGDLDANAGNLSAGNYSVTVTDSYGCSTNANVSITQPQAMSLSFSSTNVTCNGGNNGSVSVTATGGNGGYTYNWTGLGANQSYSNLTAGTYTVTVTDSQGCTASGNRVITQPQAMSLSFSSTNVTCNGGNNGSVSVTATGGNGGYTYNWAGLGANQSYSNLTAGTYTVTVTDSQGCTASGNRVITQSQAMSLSFSSTNVTCNGGNNGSVSVTATGGNGGYTYNWTGLGANQSYSNLTAGTYTVTVTDSQGCTASGNRVITQSQAMSLSFSSTNVTCNGGNNGSVSVTATGGNGGYTYNWTGLGANQSYSNLTAGTYTVTVTDSQGCTASGNRVITQPIAIQINLQAFDASCNETHGSAQVNPTGGTGALSINWSNGSSGNNVPNLNPGNYTVSISDQNSCTVQQNFSIEQSSSLSVNISAFDVLCNNANNGTALALVGGGLAPYTYEWSNGSQNQGITGLATGTYSVEVSDSNACIGSAIASISEPTELNVITTQTSPETCELNDGSATVSVTGGLEPYILTWSNGSDAYTADGLTNQSYTVSVTDANGCVAQQSVFIEIDCEQSIAGPRLVDADCGVEHLQINDIVTCESIEGASMYLWRFESISAGLLAEEYTIGGNTQFMLQNIPNLVYGITVEVRIKALVNDEWTAFGETCLIYMDDVVPYTSLTKADCGSADLQQGSMLNCINVYGADLYQWIFTDLDGATITVESYINSIEIDFNDGFVPGGNYTVQVFALIGEIWSQEGLSCEVGFGDAVGINEEGTASLVIYPNPGNGSEIFLQAYNLSEETNVSDLVIYDSNGKIVETFALNHPGRRSFKTEHQFSSRLSAGMYFLTYELGNNKYQQKMIVR